MKYFIRTITVKDYQGSHHKAVYVEQDQYFKSNDDKFIANAQKGLKIKFVETSNKEVIKELRKGEMNKIYKNTQQLTSSQIYWRRNIR